MNGREPREQKEGLFVGLDLGGTHVKFGLGREDGEVLAEGKHPTSADQGVDAVLSAVLAAAEEAEAEAKRLGTEVRAIGLGSPGVIDPSTGRALYPTSNLPDWGGVDLHGLLHDRFAVPVAVDNDANAALYGEARWGAAQEHRNVLMATVGTGIGGAALVDGRILHGAWGAGMELGHIPYREDGRACGCGKSGCLEAYAGARGLRTAWLEALAERGDGDPASREDLDLPAMLRAADAGDALALDLLEQGAAALATGLLTSLCLLNSELLVIGGGVVDGFERYFEWIQERLGIRALPKVTDRLRIVRALHGNRAGVLGAMALGVDLANHPPQTLPQ